MLPLCCCCCCQGFQRRQAIFKTLMMWDEKDWFLMVSSYYSEFCRIFSFWSDMDEIISYLSYRQWSGLKLPEVRKSITRFQNISMSLSQFKFIFGPYKKFRAVFKKIYLKLFAAIQIPKICVDSPPSGDGAKIL